MRLIAIAVAALVVVAAALLRTSTPSAPAAFKKPATSVAAVPEPAPTPEVNAPVSVRRQDVAALGVQELMALGNKKTYLNWAAIETLGSVPRSPEVVAYLDGKLSDPDARIVGAALLSLARLQGEAAIPAIGAAMKRNQVRPDGFQELVLSMGVAALRLIGSPKGVSILAAELARSEDPGWTLDYGSTVVAAIGFLGTAEGAEAVDAYAARLSARFPKDPLAAAYFTKKIDEARAASR